MTIKAMKLLMGLGFIILYGFSSSALATPANKVRIRIMKDQSEINVSASSLRWHFEKVKPVALIQEQHIKIKRQKHQWILQKNKYQETKSWPFLVLEGNNIQIGNQKVASQLLFLPNFFDDNKIDVIAYEDFEMYVAGVVSQEMPTSWSLEALKAQAVVARSYVYYKMQLNPKKLFDVEGSILDQVYKSLTLQKPQVKQKLLNVIAQTRGIVLRDSRGKVLKAFYHADCGGHTSTAQNVFGEKTQTSSVVDVACPLNAKANWTHAVSLSSLEEHLKIPFQIAKVLSDSDQGGRVFRFTFLSAHGEKSIFLGEKVRSAIGYDVLKSLNLRLEIKNDHLVFVGEGFGHGVGLCQWGSERLAKMGKSYQQVLLHYFPQAQIGSLSPTLL